MFLKILACQAANWLLLPIDPNLKISTEFVAQLLNPSMYQHLVGHLIYLTNTWPDLTFAVSVVSQFMHAPWSANLDAVHILRYPKTCPGLGLFFSTGIQSVTPMLVMLALRQTDILHPVSTLSMVSISYNGKVRGMPLFLDLQWRLNSGLWLRVPMRYSGFNLFWLVRISRGSVFSTILWQ